VVAFESPQRIVKSLTALAPSLGARRLAVCRELTKRFEEVVRGTAEDVAGRLRQPVKGEITLVIGPSEVAAASAAESDAAAAVGELVAAGIPRRAAADLVSRLTGLPRNPLYRHTL
jgi:16S rRNA (cytidine1402-2'-O)-methyltransferase